MRYLFGCFFFFMFWFLFHGRWIALHRSAAAHGHQTNTSGLRLQDGSDPDAHRRRQHAPTQALPPNRTQK